MNFLEPLGRASPTVLLLWLIVVSLALCITVIGCSRALVSLHRHRQTQLKLIRSLRIQHMLRYLGINTGRYLNKTEPPRVEIHLGRCGQCRHLEACDAFFAGDRRVPPENFCANFRALVALSPDQAPPSKGMV